MSYVIIIIISIYLTSFLVKDKATHPTGIALLISESTFKPINIKEVRIYTSIPAGAKNVAEIRVENHITVPSDIKANDTINYAKKLAAAAGANGLVQSTFVIDDARQNGPELSKFIYRGKAFYVNKK